LNVAMLGYSTFIIVLNWIMN